TPNERVYKILNCSDLVMRKSLDFLDEFLALHGVKYNTRPQSADASNASNRQLPALLRTLQMQRSLFPDPSHHSLYRESCSSPLTATCHEQNLRSPLDRRSR